MIRFIIAAILTIASVIAVACGAHFAWAIVGVLTAMVLVGWRCAELEEIYVLN